MNERVSFLPPEVTFKWAQHSGPWNTEPDRVEWRDQSTSLPCLALRHPLTGHWCGYVGITPDHPMYEHPRPAVRVHGGITFSAHCQPESMGEHRICHTPLPGEPDHLWWVGFDCGHAGDWVPAHGRFGRYGHLQTYKTLSFVRGECAALAAQLKQAATS